GGVWHPGVAAPAAAHALVPAGGRIAVFDFAGGALYVVRQTHLVDEPELLLDEIDVLFLALLNVHEELASDEVLDRLAVRDRGLVERMRRHFPPQVALEDLAYVLADEQLAEILQIRQTLEKQNALDQAVGVPHLVDGFVVLDLAEMLHAPVVEHACVQEVLVNRGKLVLERLIEKVQDLGVTFHGGSSWEFSTRDCSPKERAAWVGGARMAAAPGRAQAAAA